MSWAEIKSTTSCLRRESFTTDLPGPFPWKFQHNIFWNDIYLLFYFMCVFFINLQIWESFGILSLKLHWFPQCLIICKNNRHFSRSSDLWGSNARFLKLRNINPGHLCDTSGKIIVIVDFQNDEIQFLTFFAAQHAKISIQRIFIFVRFKQLFKFKILLHHTENIYSKLFELFRYVVSYNALVKISWS